MSIEDTVQALAWNAAAPEISATANEVHDAISDHRPSIQLQALMLNLTWTIACAADSKTDLRRLIRIANKHLRDSAPLAFTLAQRHRTDE